MVELEDYPAKFVRAPIGHRGETVSRWFLVHYNEVTGKPQREPAPLPITGRQMMDFPQQTGDKINAWLESLPVRDGTVYNMLSLLTINGIRVKD